MAKISLRTALDDILSNDIWLDEYESEYSSYANRYRPYSDEDRDYRWYILVQEYRKLGWKFFTINPNHDYAEVEEFLTKKGIEFINDSDEFLIKDEKDAIMTMLRYG